MGLGTPTIEYKMESNVRINRASHGLLFVSRLLFTIPCRITVYTAPQIDLKLMLAGIQAPTVLQVRSPHMGYCQN